MAKQIVNYTGQKNPFRKNSKEYKEFIDQRDWWMANLNLNIINDYLERLSYRVNSLECRNELLLNKLEDLEYRNELNQSPSYS